MINMKSLIFLNLTFIDSSKSFECNVSLDDIIDFVRHSDYNKKFYSKFQNSAYFLNSLGYSYLQFGKDSSYSFNTFYEHLSNVLTLYSYCLLNSNFVKSNKYSFGFNSFRYLIPFNNHLHTFGICDVKLNYTLSADYSISVNYCTIDKHINNFPL